MQLLEKAKQHPFISTLLFVGTLLGAISGVMGFAKDTYSNAIEALYPTTFQGEICDTQHSSCNDIGDFLKVLDRDLFSSIRLDITLVFPPIMNQCEPIHADQYDSNLWHPISIDSDPSNGCDKEILLSKSSMKELTTTGGAMYYKVEGEFHIIGVDAPGPLGFIALKEK